jgi:hypothetical protein
MKHYKNVKHPKLIERIDRAMRVAESGKSRGEAVLLFQGLEEELRACGSPPKSTSR